MGILAAYVPTPRLFARLEAAVGGLHVIRAVRSWNELEQLCTHEAVDIAVVDLYADGTSNFDPIRRIRAWYGTISIIAYVTAHPERARDLFDLGRAGVVGLIIADVDDRPRAIRGVVERAEARGAAAQLRQLLADQGSVVRDAVLVSITRAHERLNANTLANILTVSRRTLSAELQRAKFPPPARLVTWGRLMVAGQLLNDRQRSADAIAQTLAFPSGSAFRNTCQRYLKLKPTELRTAGGADVVLARFLAETPLKRS